MEERVNQDYSLLVSLLNIVVRVHFAFTTNFLVDCI